MDQQGSGFIASDPLGFGFVYRAESEDVVVYASRAEVAARAVAGPGGGPVKDPLAACAPVFAPYAVGARTGFAGVRLLPPGTVVTFGDEGVSERRLFDPLRTPGSGEERPDVGWVVDRVIEALCDDLVMAPRLGADERILDLTGGKDSRLVLAAAILAGVVDQFTLGTVGPPDLADVRVATSLAEELHLRHRSGDLWPSTTLPYEEAADRFVAATEGMVNVWDLKLPRSSAPAVRVSGMTGECLRAHRRIDPPPGSVEEVVAVMRRSFRAGSLGLANGDAQEAFDSILLAEFERVTTPDAHPLDALARFHIGNRARRYRGPMDELESDLRIWPLASPRAVHAAMQLDPSLRQDEYIYREVMRRADPRLVTWPFAGPGWAARSGPSPASPVVPPPPPAGPKPEALVARIQRGRAAERRSFLLETFADRSNPVWDLLDRDAAVRAAESVDSLTTKQRRQLFGAATAVRWCA